MADLSPEARDKYIEIGARAGAAILDIVADIVAGNYKSDAEIDADMVAATDKLFALTRSGGEMDRRAEGAFDKLDAAIERAEKREAGNAGERGSQGEDTDPGTPAAMAAKVDRP
jgi:hypothetical protein